MSFRTKLFLGWVALTLALWGGAFCVIRRSVEQSFDRMSGETFNGIGRGLHHLYVERVSSMKQACQLIVNIPLLRALIVEHNSELVPDNQAELQERLGDVGGVLGATFLCALNDAGAPLAQNIGSPWPSSAALKEFLRDSPAARRLVQQSFEPQQDGQFGLWVYQGRLYQVAAVPLVFSNDADSHPPRVEGALVMGKELTDAEAADLGQSYGCEISFLTEGRVAASSLPAPLRQDLTDRYGNMDRVPDEIELGANSYRAAFEPLIDPCSGLEVGTVLIQENLANARFFFWEICRNLVFTIVAAVIAAALASFLFSLAITRPVHALLTGVRAVAQGDLDVSFKVSGRDELGQLAAAFNHMVTRLRESRSELERLLDEARKAAQREHLLHDVAQQINQRLDVHSSLAMFLESVHNLFPDVQLAVFRFDQEQTSLLPLQPDDDDTETREPNAAAATPFAGNHPQVLAQLRRHEMAYFDGYEIAGARQEPLAPAQEPCAVCLVPMRAGQKPLGAIAASRSSAEGFNSDEREFLQALADHFAIALANSQLYEELRKAYQDLRANQRQTIQTERLRALGQMASGIAHDFNNHLTGILAFLEMSLDREDLDAELREWLEMSRDSSLAASQVVTLLRSFYRRDASDSLEPVDLNKLAGGTISLTRPRWFDMTNRHGLCVEVREEFSDVGWVLGNAAELRDALTNLLFNAVDAMPQGGAITVRTRRHGEEIVLEVEDTGTGMSDEVREQCLDPFYTTKGAQGTGLGLSMVQGIVERHRGQITIDSQLGRGTTIRLHLRRALVDSATQTAPKQLDRDRPRRILCVDDDVRVLKSLQGLLKQLGHDVTTTNSGADAINRAAKEFYDVLITDLGMPGVDGREVARNVKRRSPSTKVLMLTGWADRLAIEGDVPEGIDLVLGKPITKAQLAQAIAGTTAGVEMVTS